MTTLETKSQIESIDTMFKDELDDLKKEVTNGWTKEKKDAPQKSVEKKNAPLLKEKFHSDWKKISWMERHLNHLKEGGVDLYLNADDIEFNWKNCKYIEIIKHNKLDRHGTKRDSSKTRLMYDELTKSFYISFKKLPHYDIKPDKWSRIEPSHAKKYLEKIEKRISWIKEINDKLWDEEVDKYASADVDTHSVDRESSV